MEITKKSMLSILEECNDHWNDFSYERKLLIYKDHGDWVWHNAEQKRKNVKIEFNEVNMRKKIREHCEGRNDLIKEIESKLKRKEYN